MNSSSTHLRPIRANRDGQTRPRRVNCFDPISLKKLGTLGSIAHSPEQIADAVATLNRLKARLRHIAYRARWPLLKGDGTREQPVRCIYSDGSDQWFHCIKRAAAHTGLTRRQIEYALQNHPRKDGSRWEFATAARVARKKVAA